MFILHLFIAFVISDAVLEELIILEKQHLSLIANNLETQKIIYNDVKHIPLHQDSDLVDAPMTLFAIEAEISNLRKDLASLHSKIEYYERILLELTSNADFKPKEDFSKLLTNLKTLLETDSSPVFDKNDINPQYIIRPEQYHDYMNSTEYLSQEAGNFTQTNAFSFCNEGESTVNKGTNIPLTVKGLLRTIFDL